ncbi:MAG: TetR/AcrR family transcriptional regulator [Acidimicrobiales bacterium]
MSRTTAATGWSEGKRRSGRAAIVDAAWAAVGDEGLAGLSMRDLARRAGITTPTLYAYFDSKNDIYDAMFAQAAADFTAHMTTPHDSNDPHEVLAAGVRCFVEFCTTDVARYQLLFQRTIPGFEPSPESYAHAVEALESSRQRLAALGISDPRQLDMWTALVTGLVDQQISNDPGGQRWIRLIDDFVEMFLAHCQQPRRPVRHRRRSPSS